MSPPSRSSRTAGRVDPSCPVQSGRTLGRLRATAVAAVLAGAATLAAAKAALAQPLIPLPGTGAVADAPAPRAPDEPEPEQEPTDAAGAAKRPSTVQHDSEALTEQWHAAQDDVTARQAEMTTARAAVDPARTAADTARRDEEGFRTQVDVVALSTFESGRLDTFNALLASGSPQDYLDQMSALEMISADQAASLDKLTTVVERTRRAQDDADAAVARARTAADDAARAERDLADRKRDADRLVDEVQVFLVPLVLGRSRGGLSFWPATRTPLALVEERRFRGGVVWLRYDVTR
jgi:hypothetical protein